MIFCGFSSKLYVLFPLLLGSLEHRIEHYAKKRRIEVVNGKVEKIAKKAIQDDVNQNR